MGTLTAFLPPILWRHPARRAIRDYMVCKVWRTARRFDSATHHRLTTKLSNHYLILSNSLSNPISITQSPADCIVFQRNTNGELWRRHLQRHSINHPSGASAARRSSLPASTLTVAVPDMQRRTRLHCPSQSMADTGEHHRPGHCFESGKLPVCLPRLPQQN